MSGAVEANPQNLITVIASLRARYGLEIPDNQIGEVYGKIVMASRECGYNSVEPFISGFLSATLGRPETDRLISRVVNSESYFFRHREQFDALTDFVIPEIDMRMKDDNDTLKIWSAGCARGEEAYTLAIALENMSHYHLKHQYEIIGTDINNINLTQAREAVYGKWNLRELSPELMEKNFILESKKYRLKEKIKSNVKFKFFNLTHPSEPSPFGPDCAVHLIICRNVFIYFPPEIIASISRMFWRALAEGGFLLLSPSEFLNEVEHPFRIVRLNKTWLFRKGAEETPKWKFDAGLLSGSDKTTQITQRSDDLASQIVFLKDTGLDINVTQSPRLDRDAANLLEDAHFEYMVGEDESAEKTAEPQGVLENLMSALERATKATERGDYSEALEILKNYPCEIEAELLKIRIAHKNGDKEFMELLARDFRMLFPDHPAGYYYSAILNVEKGEIEDALKWLNKALYLDSEFLPAHIQLAYAYNQLGKQTEYRKAIRNAKRLLEKLDPDYETPFTDGLIADDLLTIIKELDVN